MSLQTLVLKLEAEMMANVDRVIDELPPTVSPRSAKEINDAIARIRQLNDPLRARLQIVRAIARDL